MPAKKTVQKTSSTYVIDLAKPVKDKIIDIANFKEFLQGNIKVNNKKGVLGDSVKVDAESDKVKVEVNIPFSKRYLKYLTKKYIKKNNLREYLHVVANKRDTYELRYFNIGGSE